MVIITRIFTPFHWNNMMIRDGEKLSIYNSHKNRYSTTAAPRIVMRSFPWIPHASLTNEPITRLVILRQPS